MLNRSVKVLTSIVLLAGLCAFSNVNAQGVGLSAGANFASLGDIDAGDGSATLENVAGWHVHLWFDLPLGPVAFRPGLRYMDAGRLFNPAESIGFGDDFVDDQVVTFLEVPLDVRVRMQLPLVTPYVVAGPVLRFATDTNNKDRLEELSLAAGAGVGVEVGLIGLRLYPELKYTFGVTRFAKEEYEFGDRTIRPDEDQRLNAVMLSVGIGF